MLYRMLTGSRLSSSKSAVSSARFWSPTIAFKSAVWSVRFWTLTTAYKSAVKSARFWTLTIAYKSAVELVKSWNPTTPPPRSVVSSLATRLPLRNVEFPTPIPETLLPLRNVEFPTLIPATILPPRSAILYRLDRYRRHLTHVVPRRIVRWASRENAALSGFAGTVRPSNPVQLSEDDGIEVVY